MQKLFAKKYFSIALVALLVLFGSTQFAHAQVASAVASGVAAAFNNIGYYVIGKIAFGLAYLIAWVAGVAIAIEAWLVGVMLGINQGVFQADIVQKGFAATLAIANLGFVLGIIIIALATILRRDTYGAKTILWKLVAAAILVNFSLVIVAPIFTLGNSFTTYFLNCTDPSVGCNKPQGATAFTSMNDFAANLAGAFNPQVGLITSTSTNVNIPSSVSLGSSFGQMLIPIFSIGFVAFQLVAIAVVLAVLVVMLLIRYVYIAVLAIIMPFAWLGWVFPNLKDWWSKWWQQFIRWTFFAPIVVFFLWLAMATMNSMRNGTAIANQQFGTYTSSSNVVWAAVSNFLTNAFSPIIAQSLNVMLMIGLSIAGLIVADKMSITGAKAAIGAIKGGAKAVGTYVGKKTAKGVAKIGSKAMNTAARMAAPKPSIHPLTGAPFTPLTGTNKLRGNIASGLAGASTTLGRVAASPGLKTKGLASTLWGGMKKGSGLFKGKQVSDWECQICNHVERSTKKPTIVCPNCGSPAAAANWTQV